MDRLGFAACRFRHALGSPSGRRCQQDLLSFVFEKTDQGVDRRRLSCSRSAGDDQNAGVRSAPDGFSLQVIQGDLLFRFDPCDPLFDPFFLYIGMQGAITDLASAILMEPAICDKMTAIWIGGGPYPKGGEEFNLAQ